ncbi:MAG: hypothetical protein II718_06690 [Clostridiales bacterium]|nr:hypothetical protein [Clostridiales bacterium]
MELTYPYIIYIGIAVTAILFVFTIRRIRKYKGGKKAANTDLVKEIPHYKLLMIEYGFLKVILVVSLIASILLSVYLSAKPTEVRTITRETHNRDIFICLDISTSLDEVSIDLCEELKEFVSGLKGERFGISIFNSTSVTTVPLTDDYDYVLKMIDKLESSISAGYYGYYSSASGDEEDYGYRFAGTCGGNRGSSIIGDGLAACLYSFPDLDENPDRSRLIVFVTDNDLLGEPVVTVPEACDLCTFRGVKVFALAPDFVVNEAEFKAAVQSTGGDYFNTRNAHAIDDMLDKVKETDVSVSYTTYTSQVDLPEVAVIALTICSVVYFVAARRLRL